MIEIIQDVRKKINFEKLDMRIGIHTVFLNTISGLCNWRDHRNRYSSI